jgi:hypothetical protein
MQFNLILLLALTAVVTAESHPNATNINAIFRPVLSSEAQIYLPTGANYDDVATRWSTYKEPSYIATIKPATERDVRMIVSTVQKKLTE